LERQKISREALALGFAIKPAPPDRVRPRSYWALIGELTKADQQQAGLAVSEPHAPIKFTNQA
jgi:hypothetical protein